MPEAGGSVTVAVALVEGSEADEGFLADGRCLGSGGRAAGAGRVGGLSGMSEEVWPRAGPGGWGPGGGAFGGRDPIRRQGKRRMHRTRADGGWGRRRGRWSRGTRRWCRTSGRAVEAGWVKGLTGVSGDRGIGEWGIGGQGGGGSGAGGRVRPGWQRGRRLGGLGGVGEVGGCAVVFAPGDEEAAEGKGISAGGLATGVEVGGVPGE